MTHPAFEKLMYCDSHGAQMGILVYTTQGEAYLCPKCFDAFGKEVTRRVSQIVDRVKGKMIHEIDSGNS